MDNTMVPAQALRRTFKINYNSSFGTAFTIDVDNRQYLITAKHVIPNKQQGENIDIQLECNSAWQSIRCQIFYSNDVDVDVAVLCPPRRISDLNLPVRATTSGLALSQEVFFLGFPYNLHFEAGGSNLFFPIPIVKGACVSMLSAPQNGHKFMLLDGINNSGFSGGPVVYSSYPWSVHDIRFAGVISGYRTNEDPIITGGQQVQGMHARGNSGLIIAYPIDYALEVIQANPHGAQL